MVRSRLQSSGRSSCEASHCSSPRWRLALARNKRPAASSVSFETPTEAGSCRDAARCIWRSTSPIGFVGAIRDHRARGRQLHGACAKVRLSVRQLGREAVECRTRRGETRARKRADVARHGQGICLPGVSNAGHSRRYFSVGDSAVEVCSWTTPISTTRRRSSLGELSTHPGDDGRLKITGSRQMSYSLVRSGRCSSGDRDGRPASRAFPTPDLAADSSRWRSTRIRIRPEELREFLRAKTGDGARPDDARSSCIGRTAVPSRSTDRVVLTNRAIVVAA